MSAGATSDVDLSIRCDGCGNQFTVAAETVNGRTDCPDCGLSCKVPVHRIRNASQKSVTVPATKAPSNSDGNPGPDRRAAPSFEPVYKQWETGPPLRRRVRLFVLSQLVIQPLLISGLVWPDLTWGGDAFGLLVPAVFGTILLLLLLGTFDRTMLYRNTIGDVHLTKLWRVGFVPMRIYDLSLEKFDRVRLSVVNAAESGDWLLMVALLFIGVVPGVIWYFKVISQPSYRVTLCSSGAHDDEILYRGPDRLRAEEIGRALRDMTEKTFDRL
jgi:hypothetical protein